VERTADLDYALHERVIGHRNARPDPRVETAFGDQFPGPARQLEQNCQSLWPQLNPSTARVAQVALLQIEQVSIQSQAGHDHASATKLAPQSAGAKQRAQEPDFVFYRPISSHSPGGLP
jgi:hypothetical protein